MYFHSHFEQHLCSERKPSKRKKLLFALVVTSLVIITSLIIIFSTYSKLRKHFTISEDSSGSLEYRVTIQYRAIWKSFTGSFSFCELFHDVEACGHEAAALRLNLTDEQSGRAFGIVRRHHRVTVAHGTNWLVHLLYKPVD